MPKLIPVRWLISPLLLNAATSFGIGIHMLAADSLASQQLAISSSYQTPFLADDRLEVIAPTAPLKLAEENKLQIRTHDFSLIRARAVWRPYNSDGTLEPPIYDSDLTVQSTSGGETYVSLSPPRLGRFEVNIHAFFEDGGAASRRVNVQVGLPDARPSKFIVVQGGLPNTRHVRTIYMDLSSLSKVKGLQPMAFYKGFARPFEIDAQYVSFQVFSAQGTSSPIEFNPVDGVFTALHTGNALIQTSFGGALVETCIVVTEKAAVGPQQDCHELRQPNSPPYQPEEYIGQPPLVHIRPQPQ